jgi:23S rRNA pseudouridine1911/1915/1917 synthase
MIEIKSTKHEAGERLDIFLSRKLASLTRSFIANMIKTGKITVNGNVVKTGFKIKGGEIISIDFDDEKDPIIPLIELPVLYEDENCIVINKPSGILTHSKGAYNPEGTVATFIEPRLDGLKGDRAGIVHRLDRATSGIIVCAKNQDALSYLQKQFSKRNVKKTYHAIVSGHMKENEAIIDMPIERNPKNPKTFRAGMGGKPAVTYYRIIQSIGPYDVLELQPHTGRTHQLRVHLSKLGHPIVGDTFYDGEKANRLMLHASSIEITIPTGSRKSFESPLPDDFNSFIEDLRASSSTN